MDSPLISVVVPTYNDITTLRDTLSGVLGQTHRNFEVWVVDDGSDKDMKFIIDDLDDGRINYVRLGKHTNANVARNEGIARSRGGYIAMLDADDLWMPRHLEDCLATLRGSGADGLYGSLVVRGPQGDKTVTVRAPQQGESMITYMLRLGYGAQTSTLFMTAASAGDVLWDESLNRHQDYDFVARYARKYRMVPKVDPTVVYIVSGRPKVIDFDSCLRVMAGLRDEIDPSVCFQYNVNMQRMAVQRGAPRSVVDAYTSQLMDFPQFIPLAQYIAMAAPGSPGEREKVKQRYIAALADK